MQEGIVGIRTALVISVCAFTLSFFAHVGHRIHTFNTEVLVAQTVSSNIDATTFEDTTSDKFESDNTVTFTETFDSTIQDFESTFFEPDDTTTPEDSIRTDTSVVEGETLVRCPFTKTYGDILLDFQEDQRIAVRVPSGTYSVSLASHHVPEQTAFNVLNESWRLVLVDNNNAVVFTSDAIRDIRSDESLAMERVHAEVALTKDIYHARAHSNEQADMTQHFSPVCALLRPVATREDVTNIGLESTQPVDAFTEERDASLETFRSEMEYTRAPAGAFTDNTGAFETGVYVEPTDAEYSHVRIEGDGVDVTVTGSASTYASHDSADAKTFSHVTVTRDAIEKHVAGDLFFELETISQKKRAELLQRVFTNAGATGTPREWEPVFTRTVVSEEDKARDVQSLNVESDVVFETFRFMHREELGDTVDSDGDGIIDYDEVYVYKTNPFDPFTSGGPLTDGERLLLGLNPAHDTFDVVPVESPMLFKEAHAPFFAIESIEMISERESLSSVDKNVSSTSNVSIRIVGVAPPFSFVTLYVYSNPIVVTVRADKDGRFVYTLDEIIEDGSHEIHVASVNTNGKILAKSDAIPFVKTAEAIEYTPAMVSEVTGPVDDAVHTGIALALLLFLVFSIGIVVYIGYVKSEHTTTSVEHNNANHE